MRSGFEKNIGTPGGSAGILQLSERAGSSATVKRVENMQSAPTAAAQTNDEPSSSVISAEQQHLRVTTATSCTCHIGCFVAGETC
jgi:hypothetical protein